MGFLTAEGHEIECDVVRDRRIETGRNYLRKIFIQFVNRRDDGEEAMAKRRP